MIEQGEARRSESRDLARELAADRAAGAGDEDALACDQLAHGCGIEHLARPAEEILRHNPVDTVVLSNDVSEGPDFDALARRGYRIYTIYHVDVVAYIADIYLRGWISPEATVRWYPRLAGLLPDIAKLIWEKQAASVRGSRGLVMPSQGMRETMLPAGNISPQDLDLLYISDDPEEICKLVSAAYHASFHTEDDDPDREKSIR